MTTKYQLVIIGRGNTFRKTLLSHLFEKILHLGLTKDVIQLMDRKNFYKAYKHNAPTVCLYFGGSSKTKFPDLDILTELIKDSVLILPVVNSIETFSKETPDQIHAINGFALSHKDHVESLVSCVLEGFNLLRLSRRLFISYRRVESRSIAIQLFEKLEEKGFDVFLDTHSVRKGEQFQEELWHRMVDTDIVVMLDTSGFLTSEWTKQELMKATDMSVGILQCIWPNEPGADHTGLCQRFHLKKENFVKKKFKGEHIHFTEATVSSIVSQVESLRARSWAARQTNIIKEFISQAKQNKIRATLQPQKTIILTRKGKKFLLIPTVGVPHAFTYNQSEEIVKNIKEKDISRAYLLYDHRNIRHRWLAHLDWLDDYLPVRSLKTNDIGKWLKGRRK